LIVRKLGCIVIILLGLVGLGRIALMLPTRATHQDFAHYYLSSRLLREGASPYRLNLAPRHASYGFNADDLIDHTGNPPTLVWLFSPLAALDPWPAFLIWAGVQALSLMALLWGVWSLLRDRLSRETGIVLAALTCLSAPVYYHFYYAQVQLLLAALVLAAYGLHRAGRQHSAVAVITLAGMLKLYPLALMPWFVWRASASPRGRVWYALEAVLIAAGVVALTGPHQWLDFVQYGMPAINAYVMNRTSNYSIASCIANLAMAAGITAHPTAALWLHVGTLAGLAVIGLTYAVVAWSRGDPELQFALLSTAMVVGSPMAWTHYLVLLIAPLTLGCLVLWPYISRTMRALLIALLVLLVNVGAEGLLFGRSVMLNVVIGYLPLYAMLGVISVFGYAMLANRQAAVVGMVNAWRAFAPSSPHTPIAGLD
jgi:hypothetical protein